jgi:hypothetical protein
VYLLSALESMIVARDVGHNGAFVGLGRVDQICNGISSETSPTDFCQRDVCACA